MIDQHHIVFGDLMPIQSTEHPLGKGALFRGEIEDINKAVTVQASRAARAPGTPS